MINKTHNDCLSIARSDDVPNELCSKGNISHLLINASESAPEKGVLFILDDNSEKLISYPEIYRLAKKRLGALRACNISKGDNLILTFENGEDFVITFWACQLGGIIVVPISYPISFLKGNLAIQKIEGILKLLDYPAIISDDRLKANMTETVPDTKNKKIRVITLSEIVEESDEVEPTLAAKDTTAFIQFSSGSTSAPKGVILTHENLLVNIEGSLFSGDLNNKDVMFSWMPYYHDMGLIGFHLNPLALGMLQINMTPQKFIRRPTMWPDIITKHKVTVTGSPNFGYRLLLQRLKKRHIASWDLSSLKRIFNGAEPINVRLMQAFMEKMTECHLKKTAMFPCYGMAEACLAVTFPDVNVLPKVHSIDRTQFLEKKIAIDAPDDGENVILFADEGFPVKGTHIRIVDDNREVLPEREVGHIHISGKNVTAGYINNPEVTAQLIQDGWLDTGDMGFMVNGRLVVSGRLKDVIFVNGQNIYSHDIEQIIDEIKGVTPGRSIVCGWHDADKEREVISLFTSMKKPSEHLEILKKIYKKINRMFGIPLDHIIPVRVIPKTTSGKIQRYKLVSDYKNGMFHGIISAKELIMEALTEPIAPLTVKAGTQLIDRKTLKGCIRSVWSKVLNIPENMIQDHHSFLTIGGTSLKAFHILSLLEDELAISLTNEILIKCKTIEDMVEYISETHQQTLTPTLHSFHKEKNNGNEDIAVIGMALRFPDAKTPQEYWNNIVEGKSSIREIDPIRWDTDTFYDEKGPLGKTYCKNGAFLNKPYHFDPSFFNMSKEEARVMDPQQRILLELLFEVIENAGYSKEFMDNQHIGLFMGASINTYMEFHYSQLNQDRVKRFDVFSELSSDQKKRFFDEWFEEFGHIDNHPNLLVDNLMNMLSARLSQEYNLKGPSMVIDTACSSSLVSIQLACESLNKGECEVALSGGVNLLLTPTPYIYFSNAKALSSSGNSKIFDDAADGFVPGEGAGIVMLKRMEKALEDGNHILAVIKGSGINNDGKSISAMAPNTEGQRAVIERTYIENGLKPTDIQYVEAHGTGTRIGDPSEIRALSKAYGAISEMEKEGTVIGSVKANIGHLLSAAGIASFIKMVLALKNKTMPPSINLDTPNPLIKFAQTPFYTLQEPIPWDIPDTKKRRAAINAFGFGGTNCHMVLEEAPEFYPHTEEKKDKGLPKNVMAISAHLPTSLKRRCQIVLDMATRADNASLDHIAYGFNQRWSHLKYYHLFAYRNGKELSRQLGTQCTLYEQIASRPKTAMIFTGQGCQYKWMAKDLYENILSFRNDVDICSQQFKHTLGIDLISLLFGELSNKAALSNTRITQPAIFTIDYALGKFLMSLGVTPDYLIGHSIGEWSAAVLSEVVTLEDAIIAVSSRCDLMDQLSSKGTMAAVFVSKDQIEELVSSFEDPLWISGYNITHQVVSGDAAILDAFLKTLKEKGLLFKKLSVSHAFHSPMMEPIIAQFKTILEQITYQPPKIPIVSNITGEVIPIFSHDYWTEQVLSPVKFEQGAQWLMDEGVNIFIEAGPDKTLSDMIKAQKKDRNILIAPCQNRKQEGTETLLMLLGHLCSNRVLIHWNKLYPQSRSPQLLDWNYPFDHHRFGPDFGRKKERFIEKNIYEWSWKKTSIPLASETVPGILILIGTLDISKSLQQRLNTPVIFFDTSSVILQENVSEAVIEKQLMIFLAKIKEQISYIVYLSEPSDLDHHAMGHPTDFLLLLILLKKLKEERSTHHLKILTVTHCAQKVMEEPYRGNPMDALAISLTQCASNENEQILSLVMDMDYPFSDTDRLLDDIARGIRLSEKEEGLIACRNGEYYIRTTKKTSLLTDKNEPLLIDGDILLITGGLSTIGLTLSEFLAKKAKITIILTGRRQISFQNKSEISPSLSAMIENIESLGSKVRYYSADVTSMGRMRELIKEVTGQYGPLNGVIHGAGTIEYPLNGILEKEIPSVLSVLSPKVAGTIVLDEVTRGEPLKFFAMLSSISATKKAWGNGLGDYAAANYFLDQYSIYRKQLSAPGKTIALNFSLWDKSGMAQQMGHLAEFSLKKIGLRPLSPKHASQAFFHVLNHSKSEIVHIYDQRPPLMKGNKGPLLSEKSGRPAARISHIRHEDVEPIVLKEIASHLNIPQKNIAKDINFTDLGIDSMGAVNIIDGLSKKLSMELYPTLLFEYHTPDALINYIKKEEAGQAQSNLRVNEQTHEKEKTKNDSIAIIGIGLRFPGASTLDEYWDILENGKNMISTVPSNRWNKDDSEITDREKNSHSNKGGFIENIFDFDPLFFGISPNEAKVMDPQQRIFLTVSWEALQQAGYGGQSQTKEIGVFVGSEQNGYMEHFINNRSFKQLKERLEKSPWFHTLSNEHQLSFISEISDVLKPSDFTPDAVPGNSLNEIAARVNHSFNLKGPGLVVNTACSSSLVALHLASEYLKSGKIKMAIVGGVNLNTSPITFESLSMMQALSPDGNTAPFDKDTKGMVLSEGAGAILLKPLKDALIDKDHIFSVIKGSAINNDGKSQGITVPRPHGQKEAICEAYAQSNILPETVSYVETHGTGTLLGDPIEMEAMRLAFNTFTNKKAFCAVSSLKSSMGHMLSASGISSIIKVVLAMKHKKIPHIVNFKALNPSVNIKNSPFYIVSEKPHLWHPDNGTPLRAGVNGFGFGGTNAHIILEEAPLSSKDEKAKAPYCHSLFLTARNDHTLKEIAGQLSLFLRNHPEYSVKQLCAQMNNAQKEFKQKIAIITPGRDRLLEAFGHVVSDAPSPHIYYGKSNPNQSVELTLIFGEMIPYSQKCNGILRKIFNDFGPFYDTCFKACAKKNHISLENSITFSLQCALAHILKTFELPIDFIMVRGVGVISGALVTGMISLTQAAELLSDFERNRLKEDHLTPLSEEMSAPLFGVPLITIQGKIYPESSSGSIISTLQKEQSKELENKRLKGDSDIYLSINEASNTRFEIEPAKTVSVPLDDDGYENLIHALSKLFVSGVSFNPDGFYSEKVQKILLPSYPFENKTYRVDTYKKDTIALPKKVPFQAPLNQADQEIQCDLPRLNESLNVSNNEKRHLYRKLSEDLRLFKNN